MKMLMTTLQKQQEQIDAFMSSANNDMGRMKEQMEA